MKRRKFRYGEHDDFEFSFHGNPVDSGKRRRVDPAKLVGDALDGATTHRLAHDLPVRRHAEQ